MYHERFFFSWFWGNSHPSAKIWIAQKIVDVTSVQKLLHFSVHSFLFLFRCYYWTNSSTLLIYGFFFRFFFSFVCILFSIGISLENWFDEAYEHRLLVGSCVETNRFGHLNSRCQKNILIFGWCFKNILVPEFFQHAALYKAMNKSLLKL